MFLVSRRFSDKWHIMRNKIPKNIIFFFIKCIFTLLVITTIIKHNYFDIDVS